MIKAFKDFIETQITRIERGGADADESERGFHFATAMLLLEMTRADFEVKTEELEAVSEAVRKGLGLSEEEASSLVALAEAEVDHATCLHEFTRTLNESLTGPQRQHVIELLWQVAFADGELDKYETHLVRKVAGLLHVAHSDLMRTKHKVQSRLTG